MLGFERFTCFKVKGCSFSPVLGSFIVNTNLSKGQQMAVVFNNVDWQLDSHCYCVVLQRVF